MHSLFFDTKRAHRATLKFMNPLLSRVEKGLTQARYDVLHALSGVPSARAAQSQLWRWLGVHPSTMCKLLRALLGLGLVERSRPYDRRQWRISLTDRGREVLVRTRRFLMRFVNRCVVAAVMYGATNHFVDLRLHFEGFLYRFRQSFGDGASLRYEPGWPPFGD